MGGWAGNLLSGMRAALAASVLLALVATGWLAPAHAADDLPPVPAAGRRLTDLAKALNPPEQTKVIGKLKEIEEKTGAQVAVLVVTSTQPLAMEEYAIRVFDAWKLGQARVNNGLLVLVATADKKARIEVGRGLEGAIPDARAKRIIDEAMLPRFLEGKYAAGVNAGLERIQARIVAEQKPAAVSLPLADNSDLQSAAVLQPRVDQFAREPKFEMGSGLKSLLVFLAVLIAVVVLSRLFGWDKNAPPPVITDQDDDRSSPSGGSGYGGSRDSNAMSGGGGESAGGGATSSWGESSSSSSSDSGSSDSGSSGSDSNRN